MKSDITLMRIIFTWEVLNRRSWNIYRDCFYWNVVRVQLQLHIILLYLFLLWSLWFLVPTKRPARWTAPPPGTPQPPSPWSTTNRRPNLQRRPGRRRKLNPRYMFMYSTYMYIAEVHLQFIGYCIGEIDWNVFPSSFRIKIFTTEETIELCE